MRGRGVPAPDPLRSRDRLEQSGNPCCVAKACLFYLSDEYGILETLGELIIVGKDMA